MVLRRLALQHFRSYTESAFSFNEHVTFVVGPNTSGKSNLIEAIYLLSSGKSVKAEKDSQMIQFGTHIGRVKGMVASPSEDDSLQLEVLLVKDEALASEDSVPISKKYFVNGVARSRMKFAWNLPALLFVPSDLDIIAGSPSVRRRFLDEVLELVDPLYHSSHIAYVKAIRQRNALLEATRESGVRNEKQFEYWDELVIRSGSVLTEKREEFISYLNSQAKEISDVHIEYDKSVISDERLLQYKEAEVGAGVTLVGPHRDDFSVQMFDSTLSTTHDVKFFGSRGQQRLVILQLKLLQLSYIEKIRGERPLLLLDDIFSELDAKHIELVMDMVRKQQTVITTTHKEFIEHVPVKEFDTIMLEDAPEPSLA